MGTRMLQVLSSRLDELRYEPIGKRIRAELAGETVVDTVHAVLLWEPRRVVPSYAVPESTVRAELVPARAGEVAVGDRGLVLREVSDRPVLDPSIPFAVHSSAGSALDLRAGEENRPGAAFRLDDPVLPGYVVLDFDAFDRWFEEDEPNVAHPRDPFHRIDVLASSRQVRIELDGQLLAESSRPILLFETSLPTRFYLPRADVRAELIPSASRTWCAYKGQASYYSPVVGGQPVPDLAWSYREPLREAAPIRELICFYDERVDVVLDGVRQDRPQTPWSPREQAG